ncbi:MAG: ABC transporter ATP-binding protein [Candidatus Thorarchaeota archaeon]|nr:MAG: ABC transporter ATP-binding protein [Candidatus Thorarchaeota archaeon]RLI55757.1 MAG: ABC transporter ATP-binding protein [Candidatus Thorarchaeota archaeon]
MDPSLVLDVKGLVTRFYTYEGIVKALDGVTVQLKRGDTLALVGETGCGKSVTAKSIMRLVDSPGRIEDGQVLFMDEDGPKDLLKITEDEMRHIRGNRISIVFQDPATYPNPVFKIGDQIAEVIMLHQDLSLDVVKNKIEDLEEAIRSMPEGLDYDEAVDRLEHYKSLLDNPPEPTLNEKKQAAKRKAIAMLDLVRMPSAAQVANQYPHELSGGMRQRALIAMSLSCNPSILIADEATTALDVTVQAQVLKLLNDLKSELDASIIIITHDLGVVAETCTTVAVMYAGVVVEYADTEELFSNPVHPYTTGLLEAIPKLTERIDRLKQIEGTVPNLINPPTGCRFHPRCQFATEKCANERPVREEVKPGHWVECWHPQGSMKGRK